MLGIESGKKERYNNSSLTFGRGTNSHNVAYRALFKQYWVKVDNISISTA